MRFLFGFFLKRLPREGFKSLSVPVLAFALVFLINVIWGVKARMETEYLYLVENYDIVFEVSDGDGFYTDNLVISDMVLERFFDPEAFWTMSEFIGSIQTKTTLAILAEPAPPGPEVMLWGISDLSGLPAVSAYYAGLDITVYNAAMMEYIENSDIEYTVYPEYAGIVSSMFVYNPFVTYGFTGRDVVLVSEELLDHMEHGMIRFGVDVQRGPNLFSYHWDFVVGGTVSGINAPVIISNMDLYRAFMSMAYATNWINPDYGVSSVIYDDDGNHEVYRFAFHYPIYGTVVRNMPGDMRLGSLVGITEIGAVDALMPDGGARIEFYESYDGNVFSSGDAIAALSENAPGEFVAVIGEDFIDMVDEGVLRINVSVDGGSISGNPVLAELKVVGTVIGGSESIVYSPFWTVRGLGAEASGGRPPAADMLRGTLADNRELDAFKEEAMRSFSRVGVFFNDQRQAMTIYDSEYYDRTEVLRQTIFFIDIATPFVYLISISIGFIASFLLTRRRKSEFANMRSVGVGKGRIFLGALFEQTMLCAVGVVAAGALFSRVWGDVFIRESLIFLGCYMLGASISAARAAGTDVLRLLREKE